MSEMDEKENQHAEPREKGRKNSYPESVERKNSYPESMEREHSIDMKPEKGKKNPYPEKKKEPSKTKIDIKRNEEEELTREKKEKFKKEAEAKKYGVEMQKHWENQILNPPCIYLVPTIINVVFSVINVILCIVAFTVDMECLKIVIIVIFVLYIIDLLIMGVQIYLWRNLFKPGMMEIQNYIKEFTKYLPILYLGLWIYALVVLIICPETDELAWILVLIYVIGAVVKIIIQIMFHFIMKKLMGY